MSIPTPGLRHPWAKDTDPDPALEALWGSQEEQTLSSHGQQSSSQKQSWGWVEGHRVNSLRPQDPDVQGTVPQAQGTASQDP